MSTALRSQKETERILIKAYRTLGNWRAVGSAYGITCTMAWRIAIKHYEPKDAVIRNILGMSARVEVSACPKCGGVHIKSRCDAGKIRRCDPEFVTGGMIE